MIGYGGMLMESFVAISALIAACVIDQGLYFAINSPAGATGGEPGAAAEFVAHARASRSPRPTCSRGRQAIEEQTLISRTGGAPDARLRHLADLHRGVRRRRWRRSGTTSRSCSRRSSSSPPSTPAPGSAGSCCRTRSATSGRRYGDTSWKPASWSASAVVVGLVGLHAVRRRHRPARRDQPAVPAVRHLQPAARRDRADARA